MTDDQKTAHAIGYLRGISVLLWNMGENNNVQLAAEDAVYYDGQVDVLAHALLGKVDS